MKQIPSNARNSLRNLKLLPVLAFVLMYSHVILLICGIDYPICEIVVIIAGFYIAYSFSKTFGFCLLHRSLIYYALTVMSCIWLRRWTYGENGIFGEHIQACRILMFAIGSILLIFLLGRITRRCRH